MAHINTEEAVRRSLADAYCDKDAAIARSIIDEVTRRHTAANRPANADTNEPHEPQRAQHNNTHASAQPTATHTNTIQLVPRKTDESSIASLITGGEQWPADGDGDEAMQNSEPTPPPTHSRPTQMYQRDQPKIPTRPHQSTSIPNTCQRISTPASATEGGASTRGSPVTTAPASQPSDAHPGGQWSVARRTLDLTKAPR